MPTLQPKLLCLHLAEWSQRLAHLRDKSASWLPKAIQQGVVVFALVWSAMVAFANATVELQIVTVVIQIIPA